MAWGSPRRSELKATLFVLRFVATAALVAILLILVAHSCAADVCQRGMDGMIAPDEINAERRHKDVMEAIGGLKGEIDRLEAQLTELAVRIEERGRLVDQIALGLGININA